MAKKLKVINLIPTYNERENILLMLDALEEIAKQNRAYTFHTLVVDDSSPDGTGELVSSYKPKHQSTSLLTGTKEGLGVALARGMQHAIKKLKADIIITNDADFQFDPNDIPLLLDKIHAGADVVIASRHVPGGGVDGWPAGRGFTHWVANTVFATWVAGIKEVTDHNGNFRAYRVKNCLDQIDIMALPSAGYGFLNYIIYELSRHNVAFIEVPITFHWRQRGETKVSFNSKYIRTFFRDTLEYITLCIRIRSQRITQL